MSRSRCWASLGSRTTKYSALPLEECHTVCYADDTLVIAKGSEIEGGGDTTTENVALDIVIDSVRKLRLEIASHKMEA